MMVPAADSPNGRNNGWALLAVLLAVVSLVLFRDFVFGPKYFAFADVGSDTYAQFVPLAMHMASPGSWGSAWSFNVGLGGVAPPPSGPFSLLGLAGGADHVLALRIWVYLAKIFAAGAAFHAFVLATGARRETALLSALAYAFSGYMLTDGQWDGHATDVVAYALILWAFARHAKSPGLWPIPLAVAFAACSGTFMFSVGVFTAYAAIAVAVASERPGPAALAWIRGVVPRCLAGLALAAPVLVPNVYQLLDSPRVSGAQAAFSDRLRELLSLNDDTTILLQLAGFFHKNLLGAGNQHFGWMNYLESPGFYVGMLPLLLIPQLWRGGRVDRRILVAGGIALGLFVALPAIRYAAFGFGLDYFRVNSLWVSILLLVMSAKALEVVAAKGVGRGLLAGTALALGVLVWHVHGNLFPRPLAVHEAKLAAFAGVALLLLGLLAWQRIGWRQFALLALGLVAAEAAVINEPSVNGKREAVTREVPGYADPTMGALAFIRARDPGFYRVEKTYNSVSFCDALAQGYMGVKSYWFQGAGVVGFFSELDLIPRRSRIKNFTNWLPNFGERFALYSLAGVKYMIANTPVAWPGWRKIREADGLAVYENEFALPLGVAYGQQYPRERLAKMSPEAKDITMLNAAIVDRPRGATPQIFDPRTLMKQGPAWVEDNYAAPARMLQKRGLVIDTFSDGHITGRVDADTPGILVFSIPFARGWSVAIDGVEQPVFSANLGLLAVEVDRGPHRVELRFALPGFLAGLGVALLGLVALLALSRRARMSSHSGAAA